MTERCVFIVDDSLKDVGGLLLSLQAALLNARDGGTGKPLPPGGVALVFNHIRFGGGAFRQDLAVFEEAAGKARARVEAAGRTAFSMEYCPIRLDAAAPPEEQYRQAFRSQNWPGLPRGKEGRAAFLLDLFLDPRRDEALLESGGQVLSSLLFRRYTAARCAVYAPYPDMPVCGAWKRAAGMDGEIIRREYLTRARALYLPLRRLLAAALELK